MQVHTNGLNWTAWAGLTVALALLASLLVLATPSPATTTPDIGVVYGPTRISPEARDEIPRDLLVLYRESAAVASCDIPWPILAGIADTATDHGRVGNAERRPDGSVYPAIIGPVLDGNEGRRLVLDTDGGLWDDDAVHDRALGLFQFIPRTWAHHRSDGNGDRIRDPQNIWDGAAAAAAHLCEEGADDPATVADAVTVYYDSPHFVPLVFAAAVRYVEPTSATTPRADTATVAAVSDGGTLDLRDDLTAESTLTTIGSPGDRPLLGDWDGDGDDDIAVARFVEGSQVIVFGPGDEAEADVLVIGQPGDTVLAGDWDGDGDDEPALFRSFNGRGRFLRFGDDGEALGAVDFGRRDDQPVIGDWDGDGIDELGLYRIGPESGLGWFLRGDDAGNLVGEPRRLGEQGDRAVIGDWDGDGIDTLGLHRPRRPDGTAPTFSRFDREGAPDGAPVPVPVDGTVLAGVAPAEDVPAPPVELAPVGTETIQDLTGVEYFGVRFGPEDVPLRLWRVNGIIVEEGIAANTAAMVQAAAADGIDLTAWGWRSHERQIELRRQNCPDVFDSPASACSPPTARPGTSRHEFGRALDVHVEGQTISASSPVFVWLRDHAADFGFFNLPSEPWHWSDTGG